MAPRAYRRPLTWLEASVRRSVMCAGLTLKRRLTLADVAAAYERLVLVHDHLRAHLEGDELVVAASPRDRPELLTEHLSSRAEMNDRVLAVAARLAGREHALWALVLMEIGGGGSRGLAERGAEGPQTQQALWVMVNHAFADGVSAAYLLGDLLRLVRDPTGPESVALPAPTTPFAWAGLESPRLPALGSPAGPPPAPLVIEDALVDDATFARMLAGAKRRGVKTVPWMAQALTDELRAMGRLGREEPFAIAYMLSLRALAQAAGLDVGARSLINLSVMRFVDFPAPRGGEEVSAGMMASIARLGEGPAILGELLGFPDFAALGRVKGIVSNVGDLRDPSLADMAAYAGGMLIPLGAKAVPPVLAVGRGVGGNMWGIMTNVLARPEVAALVAGSLARAIEP